jgi:hypothetical protein
MHILTIAIQTTTQTPTLQSTEMTMPPDDRNMDCSLERAQKCSRVQLENGLALLLQLPSRLPKITILVAQQISWDPATGNAHGIPEFIPGFRWASCCSILSFLCNVL